MVAAVKAYCYAPLHGLGPLGPDDLGKGLGGMADDVDVHLMQAHAHGPPQAGSTELQGGEEAGFDLLFIAADALQLGLLLRGERGAGEPHFIHITIGHGNDLHSALCFEMGPSRPRIVIITQKGWDFYRNFVHFP